MMPKNASISLLEGIYVNIINNEKLFKNDFNLPKKTSSKRIASKNNFCHEFTNEFQKHSLSVYKCENKNQRIFSSKIFKQKNSELFASLLSFRQQVY